MLTPSSALEANYGITYQNTIKFVLPQFTNGYRVLTRTQEISAAYVRSSTYKKFNPFVEAGPGGADLPAGAQYRNHLAGREAADAAWARCTARALRTRSARASIYARSIGAL